MRESYTIGEMSELFGIGADSLRYYERRGVLRPRRAANGYRLYGLRDMSRLGTIRDLRALGFSLAQIGDYLADQSVGSTEELLRQELASLEERIAELRERSEVARDQMVVLERARGVEPGRFAVRELPRRTCVRLSERITCDDEMDFVIKRLHRSCEGVLRDLRGQLIGAFPSMEELDAPGPEVFTAVFFVLPEGVGSLGVAVCPEACSGEGSDAGRAEPGPATFELPAGRYLSCCYRGGYAQSPRRIRELLGHAEKEGLEPAGDPFELYLVDNRVTAREDEFLTELQLPVR